MVVVLKGTIEISGGINGIDVLSEVKLFKISDYIIKGELADLLQNNSITIGKGLSDKMVLTKGNTIKITISKENLASL